MKAPRRLHPFTTPEGEDDGIRFLTADDYPASWMSAIPHRHILLVAFWRARRLYDRQLRVWPRLTNSVVSMLIASSADTVAQVVEHLAEGRGWDWKGLDLQRNRALAVTSAVYNGVVLTSWLLALGIALPRTDLRSSIAKLAATQLILQPLIYMPFFFAFHGLLLSQSFGEIMRRFESEYFPLLVRLWSLFMPTRLVMFLFVPVQYQVLWDSSVSFFWQVLLSLFDAKHRRPLGSGSVASMMDFEAFGYLEARHDGSPFLPVDMALDRGMGT